MFSQKEQSYHHFSKKPSKSIPRMKQDFFRYLPSDIIIDILSRLPIRTIASSKCVCKPWLHLLETDEFINSHLAKSAPMLAYWTPFSQLCTIFEFEEGLDLKHHDLHYNPLIEFDFPHDAMIRGSANGLLLLHKPYYPRHPYDALYVCNPITRDYVDLHYPKEFKCEYQQVVTFGFGVSKITGQYKVVRNFIDSINAKYECHVHTLGTESWRSIEPGAPFTYETPVFGALLDGNLHWIVSDSNETALISAFDLETENFNTFSTPPLGGSELLAGLSALGDHLCFCDNTYEDKFVIWLMKEYGVDKSWTKQYVISKDPEFDGFYFYYKHVSPTKVFRDGDMLMYYDDYFLFYYSSKANTTKQSDIIDTHDISAILLTPSFLSLKSLGMENVVSF